MEYVRADSCRLYGCPNSFLRSLERILVAQATSTRHRGFTAVDRGVSRDVQFDTRRQYRFETDWYTQMILDARQNGKIQEAGVLRSEEN